MESTSFDRLARLLGGAASRRAGLGIAAAALLGRGVAEAARPKPSGPCKSGSRRDNLCNADSECCTGICAIDAGKNNKDGRGRCRCRRAGQPCTEDKNCCNRGRKSDKSKLLCIGGICRNLCTELGEECTETTICCAGVCGGTSGSESRAYVPTCCLPIGQSGCSVDADCCPGQVACVAGTCVSTCVPLRGTCDPSVSTCCAGTCSPYTPASGFEPRANNACCVAQDQSGCVDNADCCSSSLVCNGGTCQLP